MLRVILDFTDIDNSVDKFVWFSVDPFKLRKVSDFKLLVCQKFNVTDIQLYVKNALLRDEDTISIIREEDIIRIIQKKDSGKQLQKISVVQHSESVNRLKRSYESSSNTLVETLQSKSSDNTISCIEENSDSISRIRKRKKPKKVQLSNEVSVSPSNDVSESTFANENSVEPELQYDLSSSKNLSSVLNTQSSIDVSKTENSHSTVHNDDNCDNLTISAINEDNLLNKKKRRRRRNKRHRKSSLIISPQDTLETLDDSNNFVPMENSSSYSIQSSNEKKNKHIKFASISDDESNSSNQIIDESVVEFNSLSKSAQLELSLCRNAKEDSKSNEGSFQTHSLHSSELPPKNSVSFVESVSTPKASNCGNLSTSSLINQSGKVKEESQNVSNYSKLEIIPKVGDHIAYKVLELNDMYHPEVSDYKEGIVKNVDNRGDIIIELLKYEIVKPRTGKFEVEFASEEDEELQKQPEIISTAVVNWSNMIEPQLISHPSQKSS